VLVVDDEPFVLAVAARGVAHLGHTVVATALDAAAAVRAAEAEHIDLLLTDVEMPGGDGVSLARALADRRPGLRVVFMSGRQWSPAASERMAGHSHAFLLKPFTLAELDAAIDALYR
jgi:DNA-binding NarL/FixJ family response regulator